MIEETVILAVGANMPGPWGEPKTSVRCAFCAIACQDVTVIATSSIYTTAPMGPVPQAAYANGVALVRTRLEPLALLGMLKRIEISAGRQPGPRWGPRTLDLDIIDFGGRVIGWTAAHDWSHPAELVLPHPELHKRRFVLEPLLELLPGWRHPALGLLVGEMLARLGEDKG